MVIVYRARSVFMVESVDDPMADGPQTTIVPAMTLKEMHRHIVDYACCHRLIDVICEVCKRQNEELSSLQVPHARLAGASLYKIVAVGCVKEFPTAILLAEKLFTTLGSFDNFSLVRCYAKLLCGMKVKCLFHCLQSSPEEAFSLLRKYFPHGGDEFEKILSEKVPKLAEEIQKAVQEFRKSFLPLVWHKHKRDSFMKNDFDGLYGNYFTQCLARRVATFLTELEKDLPATFIDELLKAECQGQLTNILSSDVMMEVLLNCVEGKSSLKSADLLGLLEDLSPHSSPNLQGFQNSLIAASSSGSTVVLSTKSSQVDDSCDEPSSSTSDSDILIGSEHVGQSRSCDLEEDENDVRYSSRSQIHRVRHVDRQQDCKRQKTGGVSQQWSSLCFKGGKDQLELRPCYVKLSYKRNLSALGSSSHRTKVFA